MILLYILFGTYFVAVNVYSVTLIITLRNNSIGDDGKSGAGDGKLILSALLGGAIGIYVTMFIIKFKLKNMPLMILLPVIAVLNVWFGIIAFRSCFAFFVP